MTLEQTIRIQRKSAERQLQQIQRLGRWSRTIRKASLSIVKDGFSIKLAQVRSMADAGVELARIRAYVASNAVIF